MLSCVCLEPSFPVCMSLDESCCSQAASLRRSGPRLSMICATDCVKYCVAAIDGEDCCKGLCCGCCCRQEARVSLSSGAPRGWEEGEEGERNDSRPLVHLRPTLVIVHTSCLRHRQLEAVCLSIISCECIPLSLSPLLQPRRLHSTLQMSARERTATAHPW